ncbi:MAG: AsmA family protein, partial [Woeseiaceae bacterium]|nr:AsmA family protein [Woeseiaceae bacterium]
MNRISKLRWRNIALWSVLGLFSLLFLFVGWLWLADLGVFKPQLERLVREQTGRDFSIDGGFSVDLAGESRVVAENVRLGNADWAGEQDMLTIARVEVLIDLWSLFGKRIHIELIDLDGAEIYLARRADGPPNWDFDVETSRTAPDADAEPLAFLMRHIEIDDVRLRFDDPDRSEPLILELASWRQLHRDDDYLEIDVDATLNERVINVDGESGPWGALLAGRDVRFDLTTVVDTLEITSSGHIDDLANLQRPTIEFRAVGPDIDDVTRMLGIGESGEGNVDLTGYLRPRDGGPLELKVEGNAGATEIRASGEFSDLQHLEQIDFNLFASGADISRILRIVGVHQVRESPFMIDMSARRDGSSLTIERASMIFGDARFDANAELPNFPGIDDSRVELKVEGPDIEYFRYVTGLPGAATGPFSLSFTATPDEDGVDLLDLDVRTILGHIVADGRVTEDPDYYGSAMTFEIITPDLGRAGSAYGVEGLPATPLEIRGAAQWTSRGIETLDDVVATVDDVSVRVDGVIVATTGIVGSDVNFGISGGSFARLMDAFASAAGVPVVPYDLRGRLQVQDDGYRFRGVDGTLGSSAVKIDGLLARTPMRGSQFDFVVEGPAFEEVIGHVGSFEVRPGNYRLSGRVGLQPDKIRFEGVQLNRESGRLSIDVGVGLPVAGNRTDFKVSGRGRDIRDAFAGYGNIELNPSAWTVDAAGGLRGNRIDFERLNMDIGQARLRAAGELSLEEGAGRTQFSFSAEIPSLAALGKRDGEPMRDVPLSIVAQVEGADGVLSVENLVAKLGESTVNGAVRYRQGGVPELLVDVRSDSIVLPPPAAEG